MFELRSRRLGQLAHYASNGLTYSGIILTTIAGIAIVIFVIVELTHGFHNPYVSIIAFLIFPALFALGLLLIPLGIWRRRRRILRAGDQGLDLSRFPRIDFNDPRVRWVASVVIVLTVVNAIIMGTSSFLAVEHMETVSFCGTTCHTVMQPEFTAYQQSPHSRVACVECHIGPGASWAVKSKLDGLRQVWHTALNTFPSPIETPIQTLRPARETCEACHWPGKHHGDKLRIFARFATDETNTPGYTAMLLKTGGGSLDLGTHGGVHWWHIESDNRIRYVAADDDRQEITWVELLTPDGEVRNYTRDGEEPMATEEIEARARLMDCIDCHNRPTHLFQPPAKALDDVLLARPSLRELPYFKRQALEAITDSSYETRDEGLIAVADRVTSYYQESHPELWRDDQGRVRAGADAAAQVYGRTFFPEMKTDWSTHANNIGHDDSPGCWRCHDDELATADGKHVIPMDCENCHVFLAEDEPELPDFVSVLSP